MMHIRMKKLCRIMAIVLMGIVEITALLVVGAVLHICMIQNGHAENPMFTDGDLKMIMVDVGQGDCFLFLQEDKAMLVDAGPLDKPFNAQKALRNYGVKKLDYVILTHYHQDHAAGLYAVLFNTKVDKMLVTDMKNHKQSPRDYAFYKLFYAYMNFVDRLSERDIVTLAKENGEFKDFYFSNSFVHFLAPIDDTYSITNNYSLCFKMTYGKVDILMTGDIQSEVEEEILDSGENISCEIYKAAHHGSKTSNTENFMQTVGPKFVLISSDNGNHNNFGHPVSRFVEFLEEEKIKVLRTDERGSVTMYTDGELIYYYPTELGDYKSGSELIEPGTDEAK